MLTANKAAKNALELLAQVPEAQKNLFPVLVERNWALLASGDKAALRASIDRGLAIYNNAPGLLLQDGLLKIENKDFAGSRKSLGSGTFDETARCPFHWTLSQKPTLFP